MTRQPEPLLALLDADADRTALICPDADVRLVDSGHDVVWDKGPELGHMVAEWLAA